MTRRRGPSLSVCIFAESCDRAAAQEVLLALPADAYGQVYVVDDAEGPSLPLVVPERIQVNRLRACPGRCALTEALSGWAAEWLPACSGSQEPTPTVWVLPRAAATLADHDGVRHLITVLPREQLIQG